MRSYPQVAHEQAGAETDPNTHRSQGLTSDAFMILILDSSALLGVEEEELCWMQS
jgi:hypothetical protein